MMKRLILQMIPILVFMLVFGCTPSGPRKVEVSGTVKCDGFEVSEGDILFQSEDKSAGPDGGKIVAGRYKLMAREGKNKVEVRATRTVPGKKGPMGEDWVEQYIAPDYNTKTILTADVKSGKNENVDFQVQSLPSSPKK